MGTVTEKEIIDYISSFKENKPLPRVLKILTDATGSIVNLPKESLAAIQNETNNYIGQYDLVLDAMLISTPRETAIALLYEELIKSKYYRFKTFSTREAALQWLDAYTLTH